MDDYEYDGFYDLDDSSGDMYLFSFENNATRSNYDYSEDLQGISGQLSDIYNILSPDADPDDTDSEIIPSDDVRVVLMDRSTPSYPENMIVYHGIVNNQERDLFIPYDYKDSLSVIDGYLFNISNSNIYGRLDSVDTSSYNVDDYYLTPCIGSPSSVYQYGSYNYIRDYYVSNNRITYNTIYGDFQVLEVINTHSTDNDYKIHMDLLVLITLLGVMLLCYWKKLRH